LSQAPKPATPPATSHAPHATHAADARPAGTIAERGPLHDPAHASGAAGPAPTTRADQQHEAGSPKPATNYPKPPVQHHHEPAPVLGVTAVPVVDTEGPAKELAEMRQSADPWLYDHVIAYHPHAAETDQHFAQFKTDYERQKEASEKQRSERAKAAADERERVEHEKPADDRQQHDERRDPPIGHTANA
jgi:hypothetical protein